MIKTDLIKSIEIQYVAQAYLNFFYLHTHHGNAKTSIDPKKHLIGPMFYGTQVKSANGSDIRLYDDGYMSKMGGESYTV